MSINSTLSNKPEDTLTVFREKALRESRRIAALARYEIMDTPVDSCFDHVTLLAARLFRAPIALINFIDSTRIWFKSKQGVTEEAASREPGLCASAILQDEPWILLDAASDPRSQRHSMVTGASGIRFYAGVPLRTADGHNLGMICIMDRLPRHFSEEEIAQLRGLAAIVVDELELRRAARRAIDEIEHLLRTDALTGLPNRRYFDEHAAREIARARRDGAPLCLALLDVDHFKRINDRSGHAAGDEALRQLARTLQERVRENDFVARWGGEEFALLMTTHAKGARIMLERLREAIAQRASSEAGRPLTVSIGAALVRAGEDAAATLVRADEALYEAKRGGRNRVEIA